MSEEQPNRPEPDRKEPSQPAKVAAGRPKLTQAIIDKAVEGIGAGIPETRLPGYLDVPRSTFREWMQRGQETCQRPARPKYVRLAEAVARAIDRRAGVFANKLQSLTAHAKEGPETLRWMAERDPELRKDWGPRQAPAIETALAIQRDLLKAEFGDEPEIWRRICSCLASAASPGGDLGGGV